MTVTILTAGHPDHERVIGKLIADPPAELWDDGKHDLTEVPADAVWWVAIDEHETVLALGAVWREPDGSWRSGCNAELGWRDRVERHWPGLHHTRQAWLAEHATRLGIDRITTWLHDEQHAPPGTAPVVRGHLDTGWTLTGEHGIDDTVVDGKYARQLAWQPDHETGRDAP